MHTARGLLAGVVLGLLVQATAAFAQCLMPCELRQIYIYNIGNQPIAFSLIAKEGDESAECARTTISPGDLQSIDLCGGSNALVMHDGRQVREYPVLVHHRYEIFWNGRAWDVKDITDAIR